MSPEWGYNGEETSISVSGSRFFPQVEVDAGSQGVGDVDRGFTMWLMDPALTELGAVELVDYATIAAVVPDGIEPGVYDLMVEGPTGATGVLESGFTVTDTRADALAVDAGALVYEVYDVAWIEVQLLDPSGESLFEDLEVVFEVETSGGQSVVFEDGGLLDQTALSVEDGAAITGRLGDDGYQQVGISLIEPGRVNVTVSARDPDSPIAEGLLPLQWQAGSVLTLDVDLPSSPFTATAGEAFDIELTVRDQFGNIVDDRAQEVVLDNLCGGYGESLAVQGTETVTVSLTTATSTSCTADAIYAVDGPDGTSETFIVGAGQTESFSVLVNEGPTVAGEQALAVFVTPQDAYGNASSWSGELTLEDSVGGLATAEGVGDASCVGDDLIYCAASGVVAGEDIVMTVTGQDGVEGVSNRYVIVASDPDSIDVALDASSTAAGEPFELSAKVVDAFGNVVDLDDLGSATLSVSDELEEVSCAATGLDEEGAATFDCSLFTAVSANALTATLSVWDAGGVSSSIEVVNNDLAAVEFVLSQSEVDAGEDFEIKLYGYDAWGNPYIEQSDPDIELADTSGTWTVSTASLGAAGTTTPLGYITVAGETSISASQYGVELGTSDTITVEPAAVDTVEVTIGPAWVFLGEPLEVELEAVDAYGNLVDDYDGEADLSSSSSAGDTVSVELEGGTATASFEWDVVATPDSLEAITVDEGVTGTSDVLYVFSGCDDGGPDAVMSFGSSDEAIECLGSSTGQATINVGLGNSSATSLSIAYYGASLGSWSEVDSTSSLSTTVGRAGIFAVEGVVADVDGCATEVGGWAYVGEDDGEPTGPISVSLADTTLSAGSSSSATTVTIEDVVDCTRDVSQGTVVLRSDLGDISGASASGSGLTLSLSSTGTASATLDLSNTVHDGTATVWVGAPSGAALGTASLTVEDESARPVLWAQSPSGDSSATTDTVALTLSEPLLTGSVSTGAFSVETPDGDTVEPTSVALSSSSQVLSLNFDTDFDPTEGVHVLTVASSLRDEAGNRLDGTWSGSTSDYTGYFGSASVLADPVDSCSPDLTTFRPDGDDGSGIEADQVDFTIESASAPTRWVVTVTDADGDWVLHDRPVATAAIDTWSWDGRDSDGHVVDNGAYTVEFDADDGQGNRAGACSATVSVDNLLEDLDG